MTTISADIEQAIAVINRGGIIAYPTEAVFGVGCAAGNQMAVERIQALKQRKPDKGVITLIMELSQISAWLDQSYRHLWGKAEASWPAAVTWLFPCSDEAPSWLTGGSQTIALRCPGHPLAQSLCRRTPIISTSANPAGQPPALTADQVSAYFDGMLDLIVAGECGGHAGPSQIRDLVSDKILR